MWKSTNYNQEAANTLKLTSQDCKNYKIIDDIISEIPGGAHRHPQKQALLLKKAIEKKYFRVKKYRN